MAPTERCRFYALGSCQNGSKCTFLHEKNAGVCHFYLEGSCKFGTFCQFKHERNRTKVNKNMKPVPTLNINLKEKKLI